MTSRVDCGKWVSDYIIIVEGTFFLLFIKLQYKFLFRNEMLAFAHLFTYIVLFLFLF